MGYNKIDKTKDNAKDTVAYIKKDKENKMADAKAARKKTNADMANRVDYVKANETADVAKLKADANEVGEERMADYVKADTNANVEKANANIKRYKAYAEADAEKAKTHAKP
jgi:hypothetical protein